MRGGKGKGRGGFQAKEKKKPNKFLAEKDKERLEKEQQRLDKHLLPHDKFYDHKTGAEVLSSAAGVPYASIDLIFNHKNVWANL